ncbi:MAG: hypothetical protein KTR20_15775 [Cellvibrionaceae bacterium]|nr:hypothetical protein [Cellvibrionaceae bacterium]
MTKDSSWAWQEMMAAWQANQQSMAEKMLDNFQQWNSSFTQNPATSNPVLGIYQKIFQAFSQHNAPLSQMDTNTPWADYFKTGPFKGMPDAAELSNNMQALIKTGQSLFESLTTDHLNASGDDDMHTYFLKTLLDISSPKTWLQYSGDNFDLGIHKLSEGPFFSGITDMDQRLAQVGDSWMELFKQSKDYHAIVFDRWTQAYSHYIDELKRLQKNQKQALSPKQLIDLWANIANKELLKLHRSDDFLNAQRAVIRASMQYRLHEKSIAEVICEAMHIPTRDEVDDLHKTVTELRRELRQTKTQLKNLSSPKTNKRKATTNTAKPSKKSPKKSGE